MSDFNFFAMDFPVSSRRCLNGLHIFWFNLSSFQVLQRFIFEYRVRVRGEVLWKKGRLLRKLKT